MSTCLYTKWFAGNKNKANLATKSKFSFYQKTEQCVCMWYNNPKWITTCIDRPLTHSWEALEVVSTCVDVYKKTKLICLDTHTTECSTSYHYNMTWNDIPLWSTSLTFVSFIILLEFPNGITTFMACVKRMKKYHSFINKIYHIHHLFWIHKKNTKKGFYIMHKKWISLIEHWTSFHN